MRQLLLLICLLSISYPKLSAQQDSIIVYPDSIKDTEHNKFIYRRIQTPSSTFVYNFTEEHSTGKTQTLLHRQEHEYMLYELRPAFGLDIHQAPATITFSDEELFYKILRKYDDLFNQSPDDVKDAIRVGLYALQDGKPRAVMLLAPTLFDVRHRYIIPNYARYEAFERELLGSGIRVQASKNVHKSVKWIHKTYPVYPEREKFRVTDF